MSSTSMNASTTDFERIFHPHRLAIVGVSNKNVGFGTGILDALLAIGYAGEIFPVNPKGGEIFGIKIYPRVEDIPGTIDFAIICVSAEQVPSALAACREKGAAGAEILSAGFRELGTEEGSTLEEAVKAEVRKGIRVVGPNCFGIYCPKSGLTLPARTGSPEKKAAPSASCPKAAVWPSILPLWAWVWDSV